MEGGRLQTRNKNGKMKVGRRKRRKNWDFPSGLWSTSTCCSQLKLIALAIPRFFRGHFSRNVDFRSPRGERERTSRSRGLTWPRHFQLVRRTKKPSPVQKPLPRLCDAIFFFFFFFFLFYYLAIRVLVQNRLVSSQSILRPARSLSIHGVRCVQNTNKSFRVERELA